MLVCNLQAKAFGCIRLTAYFTAAHNNVQAKMGAAWDIEEDSALDSLAPPSTAQQRHLEAQLLLLNAESANMDQGPVSALALASSACHAALEAEAGILNLKTVRQA